MPIMRNTLSEDELYMLDQLESGLRSKYGGELPKDKKSKIDAFEATLNIIPTAAGRKYAISKFLNDDEDFANQDDFPKLNADLWSIKNQEDYTPPDVEKTIEKRNKEQAENFWNWDSDEHWTKKNVNELKRQAKDAGYTDFAGYLDKVREVQTDKDREKVYDEGAMPGTKFLYPRATERFMRGEDWKAKDVGLDFAENVLYTLNPGGRAAGLISKSSKVPKYIKLASKVGDVALNPAIMEAADAASYYSGDRANFNTADVLLGSLINAGMNKITNSVLRKADLNIKPYSPVPKQFETRASEKARNTIKQQKAKATKDSKDVVDDMLTAYRNGEDISSFLNKLQELKTVYGQDNPKRVFRDRNAKDLLGAISEGATYDAVPLISNKFGDAISEDPKLSRRLINGAARGIPLVPQIVGDLVSDYYKLKDKNVEQDKINRAIKLLGKEK